ncbi:hypothetical protein [Nocardioides sp. B-3]|uniref:hypothetical protein n=1 Tax=Nocardioides sp. B-3 TaxID=2895565 RepID=UPI0021537FAC|nr:hypothetical protein [Nocardioides sp. B-3]UUZ59630.1 hypothetical protein LP418_00185 [Nocardioides sp. B-3]
MTRNSLIVTAALAVVGATLVTIAPAVAGAESGVAASTCRGKAVTIVASSTVTVGTEGDDVVAMTPSGWYNFDAPGGNDTICPAVGIGGGGEIPTGTLNAGAGDDVVVNRATASLGSSMFVGLGAGEDTFTGNDTPARVVADSAYTYGLPTYPPAGAQRDVINTGTGGGSVTSVAPPGALNDDRIIFGGGDACVVYIGAMGPRGFGRLHGCGRRDALVPTAGGCRPGGTR